MAQICRKCGHSASDDDKYCPVCCAELDLFRKEEDEKKKKTLTLTSKKALAFSIIAAVTGIIIVIYAKFCIMSTDILSKITPLIVWTGLTAISFAYAFQSRKSKEKKYLTAALIIGIIQLVAVPVIYMIF